MESPRVNRFQSACLVSLAGWAGLAGTASAQDAPVKQDAPVTMVSHHAVYKLSLLSAKGTNAPASANGVIDYDFTGSDCDGYTTNFRQLVEIQPAEGDSKLNDMRSNTFEDAGASQFTFNTKTSADDDTPSDLVGKAERDPGGKVAVTVKTPPGHADFPTDVLFPTQHLRRVIAAAEHGEKIVSADVYDGSETGQKLFHTLSVIGAPITGTPGDPAGKVDAMKELRRWPVVISYFEAGKDQPDYVLSSEIYENGISRALKLDYGDFTLAGALDQLTMGPAVACKR